MTPARQELEQILFPDAIGIGRENWLVEKVLAWHLRHQPSVSQQAIETLSRIIKVCQRPGMKDPFDDRWQWLYRCQDALALLAPEEPRRWCAEIHWDDRVHCPKGQWMYTSGSGDTALNCVVPDRWTVCPDCQQPRPTEARG